jgi:hypothetical protein
MFMADAVDAYGTLTRFACSMRSGGKRMQNMAMVITGVVCLVICGLAFFKLVPRDGQPVIGWMDSDGAAVTVTLVLLILMTIGVGLLIRAGAG